MFSGRCGGMADAYAWGAYEQRSWGFESLHLHQSEESMYILTGSTYSLLFLYRRCFIDNDFNFILLFIWVMGIGNLYSNEDKTDFCGHKINIITLLLKNSMIPFFDRSIRRSALIIKINQFKSEEVKLIDIDDSNEAQYYTLFHLNNGSCRFVLHRK